MPQYAPPAFGEAQLLRSGEELLQEVDGALDLLAQHRGLAVKQTHGEMALAGVLLLACDPAEQTRGW